MYLTLPGKQIKGNRKQVSKTNDLSTSLVSLVYFLASTEILTLIRL